MNSTQTCSRKASLLLRLPSQSVKRLPRRTFSTSQIRCEVRSIWDLPNSVSVNYSACENTNLEALQYGGSLNQPRNVLIVKKELEPTLTETLIELATHLTTEYPDTNIILEPKPAAAVHSSLPFPIYASPYTTAPPYPNKNPYHLKTDLTITLGGDGTILHAASLFSTSPIVPPVLSFGLGTLGFLGPWAWKDYKEAVKEVWTGKSRILRRRRLRMGVFDNEGNAVDGGETGRNNGLWAMNEVNIHRGKNTHLSIVDVFVDGRFLTEAVADGIILSTPTGSTAYSLSSFGSIVHPRVSALLLTPICPRSLSFRPVVLPAEAHILLRLSEKNRGREAEVSVDGQHWGEVGHGVQVKITGETSDNGGIPCIWNGGSHLEDGWVGNLTGLLKFNYPFGSID